MAAIPESKRVTQGLRATKKVLAVSLDKLNQQAATLMARGKYDAATAFAEKGKQIQAFESELDSLMRRWKEISGRASVGGNKKSATLLWAYYQPILSSIVKLGGDTTRKELEPLVEESMRGNFKAGDLDIMQRGPHRWQIMIRRSKKHLVEEGWLEDNSHTRWIVTESGRQAAKAKPVAPSAD
jgi:hypothetical protein